MIYIYCHSHSTNINEQLLYANCINTGSKPLASGKLFCTIGPFFNSFFFLPLNLALQWPEPLTCSPGCPQTHIYPQECWDFRCKLLPLPHSWITYCSNRTTLQCLQCFPLPPTFEIGLHLPHSYGWPLTSDPPVSISLCSCGQITFNFWLSCLHPPM